MSHTQARPAATEYGAYYHTYVSKVPEGDILGILESQGRASVSLLAGLTDARADVDRGPGTWNIKEVVGHVSDTERVFAYRALRFARGDATPLPGFDQNEYMKVANFRSQALANLARELAAVRAATVALLRSFDAAAWSRGGVASGAEVTVRALAHIIAGHEKHHFDFLRAVHLGM
jgi:uncharacterized damage-inducible protein DinB